MATGEGKRRPSSAFAVLLELRVPLIACHVLQVNQGLFAQGLFVVSGLLESLAGRSDKIGLCGFVGQASIYFWNEDYSV
jgi:hypothetical protein